MTFISLASSICTVHILILVLALSVRSEFVSDDSQSVLADRRLLTFGLVTDSHYDTFPAGEKAPWQPLAHWFHEQRKRTTTTSKRRYDIALDKMEETVGVFNRLFLTDGGGISGEEHPRDAKPSMDEDDLRGKGRGPVNPFASIGHRPRLDFACNLGDLVNNDLMWNLKPILDSFGKVKSPHFHLLGNHDYRAHNDRFGKVNITQHRWLQNKMVGKDNEWYFSIDYAPFKLIFINSMIMEPEGTDAAKRKVHLQWLEQRLTEAREGKLAVILFAHIPIGVETNVMGPILKSFNDVVIAAFFGHDHKGGYVQQGNIHSVTINGQIETLINAFAIVEVFADRIELTGFGRVPSRVMRIGSEKVREWLSSYRGNLWHDLSKVGFQALPSERLWMSESESGKPEILQIPPPLSLNIPAYKKPLIPYVSPNPGNTRFLSEVYSKWPRVVRMAPAIEEPVDLNSANEGQPVFLKDNEHVKGFSPKKSEDHTQGSQVTKMMSNTASSGTSILRQVSDPPTDLSSDPILFALYISTLVTFMLGACIIIRRLRRRF